MKKIIISTADIRLVSENLEKRIVRVHLHSSNKPIIRTIEAREIHMFTNLRAHEGLDSAKEFICNLFNEKYSEPQAMNRQKLSRADEAYFERRALSTIINS